MRVLRCLGAALALVCLAAPGARAQEETHGDGNAADAAEVEVVATPTTPRGAMFLYLVAAREGDLETASGFLDLSGVPAEERASVGARSARQLKTVLDQTLWIDFADLSDLETGDPDDGLPPQRDRVGLIETERGDVAVAMERQADGHWRFAAPFVARIPALYDEFGYGWLGEILPPSLFVGHFLEVQPWQWIGLAGSLLVALVLGWLLSWITVRVVEPLVERSRGRFDDHLLATARGPLTLLLGAGVFYGLAGTLRLSVPAAATLGSLVQLVVIVALTWVLFRAVDIAAEGIARRARARQRQGLVSVLPLGRVTLKVALGILALIVGLQNFGVNVTGLLAGLGFGGLAFALAAQKSLENLFGGVTVIADQPVRVGDFCRFGDRVGTVEDIGLRSTRVRTLERTVVTVPNAEFSTMQLENFAKRDSIRFAPRLGLRYETSAEQMRYVLVEIRRLLYSHPMVDRDGARVRFVQFGSSSLDLDIQAYVRVTDWAAYLEVVEDLNLRLIEIVDAAGTGFAFPSQTLYLGRDDGLDATRTGEAEAQVEQWRQRNELALPDFSPEEAREMAATLIFPEAGSQVAARTASGRPGGGDEE